MDKFYHFTNYGWVDSINRNGLVPSTGDRCKSIKDDRNGVFLTKGIDNTIVNYSFILGYYLIYNSDIGLQMIQEIEDHIKPIRGSDRQFDKFLVGEYQKDIDRITQMRSYGNFINYLGGLGCFLSISELDGIDLSQPTDCFYNKTIPSSKISVVYIIDKFTNEYFYDREKVLSYFMNLYSPDYLFSLVPDNNKKDIISLYNYLPGYLYYNQNRFDVDETPIDSFCEEQKVKILTFS